MTIPAQTPAGTRAGPAGAPAIYVLAVIALERLVAISPVPVALVVQVDGRLPERVVEALGGRPGVWSPTGGGTRVSAELPCAS